MTAILAAYALAVVTVALFALAERIHNRRKAERAEISRRVRGLRRN